MNREYDVPAALTELFYGDESTEPLEQTLDRLMTPDFVLRANGQVYRGPENAAHIRELRQMAAGGGGVRVLEQVSTDTAIAGRYLFRMVTAAGQSLTFETHMFTRIADGRADRAVQVLRQIEDGDDQDLLTGP